MRVLSWFSKKKTHELLAKFIFFSFDLDLLYHVTRSQNKNNNAKKNNIIIFFFFQN